jgi:hypothetical protein
MESTNQGEAPKLSQVIQIDEGKIQEHLGEVVRSTVEETLNAMLDAGPSVPSRAVRKDGGAEGYAGGMLPATPTDESGGSHVEGAEAADADGRDGDHRALPAAGKLRGRSAGRDVSCGSERTTSGRHHRSAVGDAGQPEVSQCSAARSRPNRG